VHDEIAAAGGRSLVLVADVADSGQVDSLFRTTFETFGGLDVLVNNAGVTLNKRLIDLDEEDWDRVLGTNTRGMFLCSRAAGRHFAEVGRGRAVNIASVWGVLGRPGFTAYCASKGAMVNFTRSAAAEWARFGAQMNAVAPGYFATDINADFRADAEAVAKVLRRVPARRMGEPTELANLVSYLALDAPDYLTGQTIALDGGESSV
jgi:3-oxoacyl-[acyl-carrier protein] reductase/2-deoxy-D-gluconate 3-dehydrogenase